MNRKQIREAIKQALVDGVPLVTGRVFKARSLPLRVEDLPAIMLFSGASEVTGYSFEDQPESHRWHIRTDVIVCDAEDSEDGADDILEQMKLALRNSQPLNCGAIAIRLAGTGEVDLDDLTHAQAVRLPVLFEVNHE